MKISEKNTKNEISPKQPNRTGWNSKYVLTYMPSNSTQLGANGKFFFDGILLGRGAYKVPSFSTLDLSTALHIVLCGTGASTKTMPGAAATLFCNVLHKTIPSCNPPTLRKQFRTMFANLTSQRWITSQRERLWRQCFKKRTHSICPIHLIWHFRIIIEDSSDTSNFLFIMLKMGH